MTEEQKKRKREKDREYRARKRAEKKAAALDFQMPPEQIEKAPESAMNQPTHDVGMSESRILDHEDFARMAKRFAQ